MATGGAGEEQVRGVTGLRCGSGREHRRQRTRDGGGAAEKWRRGGEP